MTGDEIYSWLKFLFPLNRSLAGHDTRKTLEFLKSIVPGVLIKSVKSGTKVFDWEVPREWLVREAYIENSTGNRVVDFANNNLHLVGYSVPVEKVLTYTELEKNLHSLPNFPDSIPYVTSYYSDDWGFCIAESQKEHLGPEPFKVVIDTELKIGEMNYGELIIPGRTSKEILLSTYICHPSMANDNLSGIVVTLALAKWLSRQTDLNFTYRILFIPETIGSIAYLDEHLDHLVRNVIAGWVITCVGDSGGFSYLPSRSGDTLADRVSRRILNDENLNWKEYSFLDRGSDERQYCAPGCDLPVASLMRSKYGEFAEYHTSADNLDFVNSKSLGESFLIYKKILMTLEHNAMFQANTNGEPNLGKRGLYPTLSTTASAAKVRDLLNVFAYCDGKRDLLSIAEETRLPMSEVIALANKLELADVIRKI